MDALDDSENHAKISDSAYSNSCSNSQSRRSHSSKSTHSGSHSSGSSGYGGKPSATGFSSVTQSPEKRCKDKDICLKNKKPETLVEVPNAENPTLEAVAEEDTINENVENNIVPDSNLQINMHSEKDEEDMDICTSDISNPIEEDPSDGAALKSNEVNVSTTPQSTVINKNGGFSCVIAMQDGVVMYTTSSLKTALGFPNEMWVGRSFIDFIHPRDRNTFASQISKGPTTSKDMNSCAFEKVPALNPNSVSTIVCRIRQYKSLGFSFAVKDQSVTYIPFLLKLSVKNVSDEDGKATYLVIQATPFFAAYKVSSEIMHGASPFVLRHSPNGRVEYLDPESVPYLGFLPQDLVNKDVINLYHPDDLMFIQQVYETIMKEGTMECSKPYRIMCQNGDYIKVETKWSSFTNPWSKKLEFVVAENRVVEGPNNPDVFQSPEPKKIVKISKDEKVRAQKLKENIVKTIHEILSKPPGFVKQQMNKRCQEITTVLESLVDESVRPEDELRLEIQDTDNSFYERDLVMLGGISPHHDSESKSSTETPLSYHQLNYNETLQRYFDSHPAYFFVDYSVTPTLQIPNDQTIDSGRVMSPMAEDSDCEKTTMSFESRAASFNRTPSPPIGDYAPVPLTETLIKKHNADMEMELLKTQKKDNRASTKGEREKVSNESRIKKKEHLARCNASYQPTNAAESPKASQGQKRGLKQSDSGQGPQRHHCSLQRPTRRHKQPDIAPPPEEPMPSTSANNFQPWNESSTDTGNNMNGYVMNIGMPQQISFMSPVATMPISCMMYGQPVFGPSFMYPTMNQVQFQMPQNVPPQSTSGMAQALYPLSLANSNYLESTEAVPEVALSLSLSRSTQSKNGRIRSSEGTDGESSYSSFYSSFFRTESGSAEDSEGNKEDKKKNIVCLTSELVYKYQIPPKEKEDVLKADREKMSSFQQPGMVNDQLGQLYLDLQLEGVASKLTLEEGITSSSSSSDGSFTKIKRIARRKREYHKLVMIYEEDAPMPSPPLGKEQDLQSPSTSKDT